MSTTVEKITIALTREIADNVRAAVKAGDYAAISEVVREALRDWQLKRISKQEQVEQMRTRWEAGLKSGPAGSLDFAKIKREARGHRPS
jgi:antitoxin ParD1/3/4